MIIPNIAKRDWVWNLFRFEIGVLKSQIISVFLGLVRKLSKGRFLSLRYKFCQKWYQTNHVDVSNQDVKKFVLHITLGAAGAQKTA